MKRQILQTLIILLTICHLGYGQSFDSLKQIKGSNAQIYYSAGHEERAGNIASQIENSFAYYAKLLKFKPEVTLLVLNPEDWKKFTSQQAVYGMPHFNSDKKTLFVAAEDNPFWKSFLPPLDKLDQELVSQIKATYQNENGEVGMQKFFDLLAMHELGHAFHLQKGVKMQRNWMSELFVNILLHTYIAEKEPQMLSALTLFPKMVIRAGSSEYKFTALRDMHEKYQEIATRHPKNYGWYQCRLHAAAATIYDAAGKDVGKKMWEIFQLSAVTKMDEELASLMETNVHKSIADFIRYWDNDNK